MFDKTQLSLDQMQMKPGSHQWVAALGSLLEVNPIAGKVATTRFTATATTLTTTKTAQAGSRQLTDFKICLPRFFMGSRTAAQLCEQGQ